MGSSNETSFFGNVESPVGKKIVPGGAVTIVGFGKREDKGLGEKYEAETQIIKLSDKEIHIGGNGRDSCRIDSGGPAYARLKNGEWRVFGVVSRGIYSGCGRGGIWGLMHEHICWVQRKSKIDLGLQNSYCSKSESPR